MQLVLEVIDPDTECVRSQVSLEVSDVAELNVLLGTENFDPHLVYSLSQEQIVRLAKHANCAVGLIAIPARLRGHRESDDLPYQTHTNRELLLMLEGTKPLASFVGQHPIDPDVEDIPERLFDPYVSAGRLLKHEFVEAREVAPGVRLRRVLYALPSEEWRIKAYTLMLETAEKSGWNEGFERMEGALLGYQDWQNDAHIRREFG